MNPICHPLVPKQSSLPQVLRMVLALLTPAILLSPSRLKGVLR
jgi:hypothetical protein